MALDKNKRESHDKNVNLLSKNMYNIYKQGHCRSIYLPPGISNNGELNEIRAL